ncbi:hypothetical protein N7481_006515 [Penicillium waksmanii]|uniref:uncharacterized protein n=1 Tax=Penicillium waksmanii TaxID=69791 RepID=UPI0025489498|nr:uncharacterized protein N7481_006515 [Penicillium waksmanii]KAJ5984416.1 hypothetical protein N7481_006515 [Penicillium waksmanii]
MQAYYAAAVSAIWIEQEVFIAKLSSGLYDNWDDTVCGLFKQRPDQIIPDETSLFGDGDTDYFVKRTSATPTDGSGYLPVKGAENTVLGKYGLYILTVVKSAEWTQANVGFGSEWTAGWVSETLLNQGDINVSIYMSIPVLDLVQFRGNSDVWSDSRYTGGHCNSEVRAKLVSCIKLSLLSSIPLCLSFSL